MALRAALLARTPMWSADLFTISLASGEVYRWTSADQPIGWSGVYWFAAGPAIERTAWSAKNTTEVTQMDVTIYSTGTDFPYGPADSIYIPDAPLPTGQNIKQLAHEGLFDGAYVQLDRAFMPTYGDTSLGLITMFAGRTGKVEIDSLGVRLTVLSSNVILQQNVPRNTYQLGCIHTLYDSGCTLSRAAHTTAHVVTAANQLQIDYAGAPADPSVYQLGVAAITSGAGAGQRRAIDGSSSAGVLLAYPLYIVPAPGDTFTLTEGCNKTKDRCIEFDNLPNFRGFPNIPKAELGI
jgi:uncharacterized phage protein (TIGR02218 family)